MLFPINNLHEKSITDQTLTARALLVICTRFTTLHPCYKFFTRDSIGNNLISCAIWCN